MTILDLKYLEVYGFADPASGKDARAKKRSARQAIVYGARDWYGRWFVLYTWAGRETASNFKNRILDTYDRFRPRRFGIEANAMQILFGSLVRDAGRERFGELTIIPVYQPTKVHKDYRIRVGLETIIASGQLFILDKTSSLATEIRGFPTASTKDLVDALESMIRMAPKVVEGQRQDREMEAYARYLRNSGCPPMQIERKLVEYQRERMIQPKAKGGQDEPTRNEGARARNQQLQTRQKRLGDHEENRSRRWA